MTEIAFAFTAKEPARVPPGKTQTTIEGYGRPVLGAVTPVYVDFYERHRKWIEASLGGTGNVENWPPLLNFARMIRNFISHSEGRVHFENDNATPVTWHHLCYSPADDGKLVIGGDFHLGDLIVLLFEFGDELDSRGCPLNP